MAGKNKNQSEQSSQEQSPTKEHADAALLSTLALNISRYLRESWKVVVLFSCWNVAYGLFATKIVPTGHLTWATAIAMAPSYIVWLSIEVAIVISYARCQQERHDVPYWPTIVTKIPRVFLYNYSIFWRVVLGVVLICMIPSCVVMTKKASDGAPPGHSLAAAILIWFAGFWVVYSHIKAHLLTVLPKIVFGTENNTQAMEQSRVATRRNWRPLFMAIGLVLAVPALDFLLINHSTLQGRPEPLSMPMTILTSLISGASFLFLTLLSVEYYLFDMRRIRESSADRNI